MTAFTQSAAFARIQKKAEKITGLPQDNKNYNLLKSGDSKAPIASSIHPSQVDKDFKNYKHDHKDVWYKIHTDPMFKMALDDWGYDRDTMMACFFAYGEYTIKEAIQKISRISDSYFRHGSPVPKQRAALLGSEMNKLRKQRRA